MKKIYLYLMMVMLSFACLQTSAQVIDMSTGVDANGNLIPLYSFDDTWTVKRPGQTTYQPVRCGSGIMSGYTVPYPGKDITVGWLSPYMLANGQHDQAYGATTNRDYYYRMTFEFCGSVESAVMEFNHIGGDNFIDQIIVNGSVYPVYYPFNPFVNNTSLPINPGHIWPGTNEILVRVHNNETWTGMEINGSLNIQNSIPTADAYFSLHTPNATTLHGSGSPNGNHTWEIYHSNTGNVGSYAYLTTLYNPGGFNMGVSSNTGPCFLVKHTVSNECGTDCASQSICYRTCDQEDCGAMTPPTGLYFEPASYTLNWAPVPGATSYSVGIVPNDPACCRNGSHPGLGMSFSTSVPQLSLLNIPADMGNCFSWTVTAICPGGGSATSQSQCVTLGGLGKTDLSEPKGNVATDGVVATVFPNPSKGLVTMNIETATEGVLTIAVSDMNGKTIRTFENIKTTQKKAGISWNTEGLAKGSYLVKITTSENRSVTKKLIVQ